MSTPEKRILVALSGGKDSIALAHFLQKSGYAVTLYHIDLGLGDYSEASREKVDAFARQSALPLIVDRVTEILGAGVGEAARKLKRPACAVCGTVKRHLMNRAARDFDCVATGHNLDDEGAVLLGNLLHWQTEYLGRQHPVLPARGTLAKKVKPFAFHTEYETANYAFLEGLDTIVDECPRSVNATSIAYKEALNRLEERMPGTKHAFFQGFLTDGSPRFTPGEESAPVLAPCRSCGELTSAGTCSVCRFREKLAADR